MKNLNNAKIFIFILGLILIALSFVTPMLADNSTKSPEISAASPLPEGVHIPININTADKETLCLLPGIGEFRAEKIIAYREEHGDFKNPKDIVNVYGIGETLFDNLRLYISTE